ncbi:MAG: efflux RND transporter permease subunit [Alphaproteobacteria bacterium]|nr:efflux RND transporter permease subunit [Alphaproteobacteria bacterium]
MAALIDAALDRSRTVMLLLVMIFLTGIIAYHEIPKESNPDVRIPIIYVSMHHEGISPQDAERLLLRPMEKKLKGVENVKEMRSFASESHASVVMEFEAGFDNEKALRDVRTKVDEAKADLPADTDEPLVQEITFSQFPVVNVILTGQVEERALVRLARDLRDKIEATQGVLSVSLGGDREDVLELLIDPKTLESYGLSAMEVFNQVQSNNLLVSAGQLDTPGGSYPVKVPGLLENAQQFLNLPIRSGNNTVVRVKDVAEVRRTFKDPTSFARVNGQPAVVLEVKKRTGHNLIETVQRVKDVVEGERSLWKIAGLDGVNVIYSQDTSQDIRDMVEELENAVIFAVILVTLVIIAVMGARSAMLVSLAIPGSFLIGILALSFMGYTANIVVLFSLILAVGMLVDDAIVVCEYADRRMIDGMSFREAYAVAAKRMLWPVVNSTMARIVVFGPLLFWPGIVGQFMKYLPITVNATLIGSLVMALIFLPVLGTRYGRDKKASEEEMKAIRASEEGDLNDLHGFTRFYAGLLDRALDRPGRFVGLVVAALIGIYAAFFMFGPGVEFFPDVEPKNVSAYVRARGNLSTLEKDGIVREVEKRIYDIEDVKVFYARSGTFPQDDQTAEDVIGIIQMELKDWRVRRKADKILEDIRARTADIPGIILETRKQEEGPGSGKPVHLQITSRRPEMIAPAAVLIAAKMRETAGLIDVEDDLPLPALEWQVAVDREMAGRYNVNVAMVGSVVRLVTYGLKAGEYRPDDADDEVDVMVRFPPEFRSLSQLDRLRVATPDGQVPIGHFVTRDAKQKIGAIRRVASGRVINVKADLAPGVLADAKVQEMRAWMLDAYKTGKISPDVNVVFKGEDKDQQEAGQFLMRAFSTAIFLMVLIILTQFNSAGQTAAIMSAVFLSTGGVLLGLLVTQQPFGIVMCGMGIIALAGIVVNNNIILLDTFKHLREEGHTMRDALMRAGVQRLRPILLTAATAVLGLLPMVFGVNINFYAREITVGAPSSQWWTQLSASIAGGLTFATVLTLLFTPCLMLACHNLAVRLRQRRRGA